MKRPLIVEIGAGTGIPTVRHFCQLVLHEHRGRQIRIHVGASRRLRDRAT